MMTEELKRSQGLILVLMEDALRACWWRRSPKTFLVLILVLMEDALRDILILDEK